MKETFRQNRKSEIYIQFKKYNTVLIFIFMSALNCLTLRSIPDWGKEKIRCEKNERYSPIIYSGTRSNFLIKGIPGIERSKIAETAPFYVIDIVPSFVLDTVLLPISVLFAGGFKVIEKWRERLEGVYEGYNFDKIKIIKMDGKYTGEYFFFLDLMSSNYDVDYTPSVKLEDLFIDEEKREIKFKITYWTDISTDWPESRRQWASPSKELKMITVSCKGSINPNRTMSLQNETGFGCK